MSKHNKRGQTFLYWYALVLGREPTDDDTWGAQYAILREAWERDEWACDWADRLNKPPAKSGMLKLRQRIAEALGWTVADTRQMNLAMLRECVRSKDAQLADEISGVIQRGDHLYQAEDDR